MMIDAKTLRLVTQNGLQNFAEGRVLDGIAALRTLLPYCPAETILHAEAESLEENYHRMLSFLREGGNDEKRGEVQAKIQRQGVHLLVQASRAIRLTLDSDLYCVNKKTVSLDEDVLEDEYIGCHPCVCTSSLKIRTADVIGKFLPATGHGYTTVHLVGED